jgi:hypothetical protein
LGSQQRDLEKIECGKAAYSEQAHLYSREVSGGGPLLGGVKDIEIIL